VEQFYDEEKDLKKDLHDVIRERAKYLFAIAFPNRLALQKELGQHFLSMGMAASGLKIFEQFEMWENVIACYRVMGKNKKVHCFWQMTPKVGSYHPLIHRLRQL